MWESMGLPLMFCSDVKRKHSKLKIILIKYYSPFYIWKERWQKPAYCLNWRIPLSLSFIRRIFSKLPLKNIEASLLSPLTVDMFLHLSKHKRVLFTSLVGYRVPKKMKDLKSWPVSTNFDLMKRLSLIIYFFLSSINDSPPLCHIYINVAVTFTGSVSRECYCRYTGHGTSPLWEWCQNKGSHG